MGKKRKSFISLLKSKRNLVLIALGVIALMLSLQFYNYVGRYADSIKSPPVGDLVHDILPMLNWNLLATGGFFLSLFLIFVFTIFFEPEKFSFGAVSIAVFVLVRSVFISMTHLGAPFPRIDDVPLFGFNDLYFDNDLFPSGHVGVSFLGFLLFKKPILKAVMLICSIALAFAVLTMRLHYSIDVFAAYFIVFGVFYFCKKYLFNKTLLK